MPRRTILSDAELASLLALPDTKAELICRYTLSDADLSITAQHRGPANRLGFAVQLCYKRYPGVVLGADDVPSPILLRLVAAQLKIRRNTGQPMANGSRLAGSTSSNCKPSSASGRLASDTTVLRCVTSKNWLGRPTRASC